MSAKTDELAKLHAIVKAGGVWRSLLSSKRARRTAKDRKLEMLGGRLENDDSPTAALIRELREEEETGLLAELVEQRSLPYRTKTAGGATHHLFELTLSQAEYDQLQHDPDESHGFELLKTAELESGQHRERLTPRTASIFDAFGYTDAWPELKKVYAGTSGRVPGVALVLGAGVSARILPDWTQLLQQLAARCVPEFGDGVIEELDRAGFSHPAIAGMLESRWREGKGPNDDFADVVRETLYRDLYRQDWISERQVTSGRDFVDYVRRKNATLSAVASFCARKAGRNDVVANPLVHAVVTFNIDHLLQVYSRSRFGTRLTRTVERPSKTPRPGKINLYHLHGCIRFDKKSSDPRKNAPDAMVLTEHSYFDVFNQPTSFLNYTFLHVLREYPCVFVGLSMQDENLRRLLHYSRKEREEAYELEKRPKPVAKTVRHFAIQPKTDAHIDELTEESLRRLGVRVLWIEGFGEVPERLKNVYGAVPCEGWEAVWDDAGEA